MSLDETPRSWGAHPCSTSSIDVDVIHEAGEVVVLIRGSLDRAAVRAVSVRLEEILEIVVGRPALVVDLAGVSFVDVAGINMILHVTRCAAQRGVQLYLAGCSSRLVRLLGLLGVLDELRVIAAEPGYDGLLRAVGASTEHTGPSSRLTGSEEVDVHRRMWRERARRSVESRAIVVRTALRRGRLPASHRELDVGDAACSATRTTRWSG